MLKKYAKPRNYGTRKACTFFNFVDLNRASYGIIVIHKYIFTPIY